MCLGMALLTVCSCTKEEGNGPSTDKNGPITLELADQTATTAVFKGSVNLDLYSKYDEVGILYSLSEDMEIEPLITNVVPITNIDKNNRFEKKMRSLLYGTKYYYSSYICMNGIYKFGEIQSFTTDDVEMQVSAPTVTSTTATFKGKVEIAEDDMESLSFGIAWSTGSDFDMNVNEDTAGLEEDGTFTLTISDLKMDTEYHYATCIRQVGSQYGEIKKFVTTAVSMTASATKVTQTTVTFTGQVERNKADDSIEYGILYSTGTNLKVGASGCTCKTLTDAFDSNGKYSLKVTGLSNDTQYNYCWYARQGSNYKYGPVQQFTTSSVTINLSVTSITQTTATFTGDYEQPDGNGIEIGVLYSLSSSALKADSDAVEKIKLTNKTFRQMVSDLKYNTTYYYCTYVYQSGTYKYGSVQNFKTNNVTVEVSVGDITQTTATFRGKTEITESDAIEVGILYSTSSSLSPTSSSTTKKVLGNGSFSFKVEDLRNNTRYYYQYYIKQDGKYVYGERQNFMTSSITASLSEPVVTQTTATFSGNVSFTESDIIKVGIRYSTENDDFTSSYLPYAAAEFYVTDAMDANGSFTKKVNGLSYGTKYYYCYFVVQNGKYTFGNVKEFTTQLVEPDIKVGDITQTTATFLGIVDITEPSSIQVGIRYSASSNDFSSSYLPDGAQEFCLNDILNSEGQFTQKVTGLYNGKKYYYCYFVVQNGEYAWGNINTFETNSISINIVPESTQTTITFTGDAFVTESDVIEIGLLYSTLESPTISTNIVNKIVLTDLVDLEGKYKYMACDLQHNTIYYYRYYIKQGNKYTYGPSLSIETKPVIISLATRNVTKMVTEFIGQVDFTEDGTLEVGILLSSQSNLSIEGSEILCQSLTTSSGGLYYRAENLSLNSLYYWCYYIRQGDNYTYGATEQFVSMDADEDLSHIGTSNCYIVSNEGWYKFKAVKGAGTSRIHPSTVEVLWESYGTDIIPRTGDLIQQVIYDKDYIVFNTSDIFKEGNAVIAAKDSEGYIIWSWHIWMTDQPKEQTYYNNAGVVMDRNLGATSSTPGDVGALGLFYQWGRKDPFLGASSILSNEIAKSTIDWPASVTSNSRTGNIAYSIANPTTFITCNSKNFDWCYTGSSSTDNTRWTSHKSVWDPCPVGWKVPTGGNMGLWAEALGESEYIFVPCDENRKGINFSEKFGDEATIWYPAAGSLSHGNLSSVGVDGRYWSCTPSSGNYPYYVYRFDFSGSSVYPAKDQNRANGFSVRCVKQ